MPLVRDREACPTLRDREACPSLRDREACPSPKVERDLERKCWSVVPERGVPFVKERGLFLVQERRGTLAEYADRMRKRRDPG